MRVAILAGLVLIGVYITWVVVPNIYLERKFPPPKKSAQSKASQSQSKYKVPSKGRYRITIVSAKIFPTNKSNNCWDHPCWSESKKKFQQLSNELKLANGNKWDIVMGTQAAVLTDQSSKQPDAKIKIKFSDNPALETQPAMNTLTPRWGLFRDLTLKRNATMRVYVWDKDAVNSDLIGYYATAEIPPKYLAQGGTWKLRFHRVYELTLTITPLRKAIPKNLLPGKYRITVMSAIIKGKKANGKSWDFMRGLPDPYAIVYLGPHQLQTRFSKNTLYPAWNHSRIIKIKGHEVLRYKVFDKELTKKDELIGACQVTALKTLKLKDGVLFRGSCGQIQELNIKFDRIL